MSKILEKLDSQEFCDVIFEIIEVNHGLYYLIENRNVIAATMAAVEMAIRLDEFEF